LKEKSLLYTGKPNTVRSHLFEFGTFWLSTSLVRFGLAQKSGATTTGTQAIRPDATTTLKILQISSASTFGGGERYVVDLTNALQSRGHDLYVIVRPNSPLPPHLEIPKDKIKELPLRNALDAPSARELDKFVKENQIDVVHAHMARDYSLAAYATRRPQADR